MVVPWSDDVIEILASDLWRAGYGPFDVRSGVNISPVVLTLRAAAS